MIIAINRMRETITDPTNKYQEIVKMIGRKNVTHYYDEKHSLCV